MLIISSMTLKAFWTKIAKKDGDLKITFIHITMITLPWPVFVCVLHQHYVTQPIVRHTTRRINLMSRENFNLSMYIFNLMCFVFQD